MRKRMSVIFRSIALLFVLVQAMPAQGQERWLLAADRLFDGEALHENHALLIENSTIIEAGPRSGFDEDVLPVTDLGDATLLPGFIEPHAHLTFGDIPADIVLRHGITTLRDLGGPALPMSGGYGTLRILSAGVILTPPDGYPIPNLGTENIAWPVANIAEGIRAVQHLSEQGVSIIKVALEPGGEPGAPWNGGHGHGHAPATTDTHEAQQHPASAAENSHTVQHFTGSSESQPGSWPLFPVEIVAAIVDEAHRQGLEVIAHVGEVRGVEIALDAGVDQWAHIPCTAVPSPLLERAATQGVKIITTSDTLSHCPGVVPNLQTLAEHGADLYYGSEVAHQDVPWGINGQELMNLVQFAGMTPAEAVSAATARAGRLLNIPLLGTLSTGAPADIIAVCGNPLLSPMALKSLEYPELVISGGRTVVDWSAQ